MSKDSIKAQPVQGTTPAWVESMKQNVATLQALSLAATQRCDLRIAINELLRDYRVCPPTGQRLEFIDAVTKAAWTILRGEETQCRS